MGPKTLKKQFGFWNGSSNAGPYRQAASEPEKVCVACDGAGIFCCECGQPFFDCKCEGIKTTVLCGVCNDLSGVSENGNDPFSD